MNGNILLDEIKNLLDSECLVTARLVESITKTAQLSAETAPEIQSLFQQWLSLITKEVKRIAEPGQDMSIPKTAQMIGISPSSLLALLLFLQRNGEISVDSVKFMEGTGKNEDLCSCLFKKDPH